MTLHHNQNKIDYQDKITVNYQDIGYTIIVQPTPNTTVTLLEQSHTLIAQLHTTSMLKILKFENEVGIDKKY